MDLVLGTASIWAPIVIGLFTALVGRAVLTASTLRRDLATDLRLLETMPSKSRAFAHLNRTVHGRVVRLVAQVRYPTVAATDLVGLVVVLACAGVNGLLLQQMLTDALPSGSSPYVVLAPLLYGVFSFGAWAFVYKRWSRRAAQRFVFLRENLDDVEAVDLIFLTRTVMQTVSSASGILVMAPTLLAFFATVYRVKLLTETGFFILVVGSMASAVLVISWVVDGSGLNRVLRPPSRLDLRFRRRQSRAERRKSEILEMARLIDNARTGR